MKRLLTILTICSLFYWSCEETEEEILDNLLPELTKVQIVHNSHYPTVDIHVNGSLALEDIAYRTNTALLDLPTSLEVGIAPAGGEVIETFPFVLDTNTSYVVFASGILNDNVHPFDLMASTLEETAADDNSFALKVMHGVTDAPAIDIYANGNLLVENLAYGDFQGYLQVPATDYTLDITPHGSLETVASFSAPLTGLGGGSGIVYASGFLSPTENDSAFTLILVTPSGYSVQLPEAVATITDSDVTGLWIGSTMYQYENSNCSGNITGGGECTGDDLDPEPENEQDCIDAGGTWYPWEANGFFININEGGIASNPSLCWTYDENTDEETYMFTDDSTQCQGENQEFSEGGELGTWALSDSVLTITFNQDADTGLEVATLLAQPDGSMHLQFPIPGQCDCDDSEDQDCDWDAVDSASSESDCTSLGDNYEWYDSQCLLIEMLKQ